jgi:predicted AlkP superfamily pyrophosphatase or phosphodiesterase
MNMHRLLVTLLLTLLALPVAAETSQRVLVISIDGLRPGDLLNAPERGLEIEHLSSLMKNGITSEGVIGVLPSVTYPSHVTIFTGVPPTVHGIASNHVLDPEDRGQDPWYWFAEDIRVPTLIHAAEANGLVTGAVSWPATIGLPADYVMPEFWRGRSSHPFDRRFIDYFSTPGMLEAAGRFRNKPIPSFSEMRDRDRADVARWIIATAKPDLLLVHLFDLDFAQHNHGPGSPEAFAALERTDALVGEILAEARAAGVLDSTVVFIVSDHGFFPVHTMVAPNTLLVEEGIIRLDDDGRVEEWDAYFLCDSGSAALVLKDPTDDALLERIDRLVSTRAAKEGSGIHRILRADEAGKLGSPAPLVLDAASGYDMNRRLSGEWTTSSRKKGTHGHAPDRDDAHASLVISGRALQDRGVIGRVRMTRIAPTVAAILGLTPSPAADEPIPLSMEVPASR